MPRNKDENENGKHANFWTGIGAWAFVAGLVIAVLAAFFLKGANDQGDALVVLLLGIIGLVIGVINVTDKEAQLYLVAAIAFLVSANSLISVIISLPGIDVLGVQIALIFTYVIAVVAPSAAVVALKAIFEIARSV